jgi:hypothetical protein
MNEANDSIAFSGSPVARVLRARSAWRERLWALGRAIFQKAAAHLTIRLQIVMSLNRLSASPLRGR